ncbi:MAG: tetratricopeptide repeat protein [Anaerolineae bacterium]
MPKGAVLDTEAVTSVKQLRDMIRQLEIGAATLKGRGVDALELLKLRDLVDEQLQHYTLEGVDLRPERTRVETIDNVFARKTSQLNHELRSIGGLAGARQQVQPREDQTWWFSDIVQSDRQRRTVLKTGGIVVGILLVLIVGNAILDRLYGLSPLEKEARAHVSTAEQQVVGGDIDAAIAEYEQALAVDPSMGDAQVALGVLYEAKGRTEDAEKALTEAEAAIGERWRYLLTLARTYEGLGKFDEALVAADEAVALAPDSPEAYLTRGGLHEQIGNIDAALDDLERASTLASEQGVDQIYVLARYRYGMLLQRGGGMQMPTPTE